MSNLELSKIYYSTQGYWKGYAAITKLAKEANVSEEEAEGWLEKQALWEIYLPPPKYIPIRHWSVDMTCFFYLMIKSEGRLMLWLLLMLQVDKKMQNH